MNRNILFYTHSVAGFLSGLFILLMSLSGALLVFHDELDQLQYPAISIEAGKSLLSLDSCYASVQKKYPHAQISNAHISEKSHQPFVFTVYDSSYEKGTRSMQVFIHPQTGTILQTRGGGNDIQHNFMSWLGVFHNSFHLDKKGEWLLGFFAIIFLISITTGLFLYRKNIWAVLCFRKTVYSKKNLHQLIGVYALLFNVMIAVTGFWMQRYVFKKEFYASQKSYTPVLKPSEPLHFRMDRAFSNLHTTYPAFTGYVIYFAQTKKGKTAVYGSQNTNAFIHSKKYADVIFLDSTGQVAKTAFIQSIDPDSRYDIINAQIHYGRYGGLAVKILYSLLGLTGGLLSITGFLLWIKKRKKGNNIR